ncbi:MAG: transcriptional regulator, MarR family [Pelosinus sp.]|jgi:DNA-binding MarR family transcriptional regulator|nr:transcriptional regulator, MarR family [Pelosinus sp.]
MKNINQVYPKDSSPCNCMNIRRASRAVTQFYDEALKPSGLTISQMGLLRHIKVTEMITISDLAKMMRIDRTTLNRNMKPLDDAGLLVIRSGEDSRTRQISLTDEGKVAVDNAWKMWGEAQSSLKEYLGKEDLGKLTQLLAKLEAIIP